MNRREAIRAARAYIEQPHRVIALHGLPLDQILHAARPDVNLLELVPTLLDWLDNPDERELVWRRIFPAISSREHALALMCPDDLDRWCSIVVTEVIVEQRVIVWHRPGVEVLTVSSPEGMPESAGTGVEWREGPVPY